MKKIKMIFLKWFFLIFAVLVTACHSENSNKNKIKMGTIAGPETDIMKVAKAVAKKQFGLDIQIVEFTDYLEPNAALNDGSIDANLFQHQPYLDQQTKDRHYNFVVIGKTFIYPMGVYSAKIKSLQEIPEGSVVAIPNDPSNEGRALLLLQKAKLIQLKKDVDHYVMPENIIANPKKLVFKELDAAQIARSLPDVTIGVINTNYAIPAGLTPTKDALFLEGKDSLYANIIVVRPEEAKELKMKQLVAALHSNAVVKAAQTIFGGQAISAW
ncbi:MAG: metQ [Gammaproteobacteria bacterium]|jgi:D-methionine transport system substrate-binding protein|nr:metQ [Gammaproteobacteria bacterium]MCE3237812.1 metQ [Gammaproteobacteria bacterium]